MALGNANPPPQYVIAEAKYNTAHLGYTKDGKTDERCVDKWR